MKFVIDANGLAPIAEALSGRSRVAGVAAGLKNKILAEELDAQRVKTMRGRYEYNAFKNLMEEKEGTPVSAERAESYRVTAFEQTFFEGGAEPGNSFCQ